MRLAPLLGAAATALLISACGSTAAAPASTAAPVGPGAGPNSPRRGAAGELARIDGSTLILNSSQSGDITVMVAASTTVRRTSTGTVADIVGGSCILALGQRDASGLLTAQTVLVSARQNGGCTATRPGGGPLGAPGGLPGGAGARPFPGQRQDGNPNRRAIGEVTAVNGTAVTLRAPDGAVQTLTVPTTVRVGRSAAAAVSDLRLGQCIQAAGPRDSGGAVHAANLTIVPPGPGGCFTGGGLGGFGGFGGQRPGGQGGPPGGPPPD